MARSRAVEARLFEVALTEAIGPAHLALMVEKWSDSARAAASAARRAKKGGSDWRKAARAEYMQRAGVHTDAPLRSTLKGGGPAHDVSKAVHRGDSRDPAVKRARKLASKVGDEPQTWGAYDNPRGKAYANTYARTMNQSFKRRKDRFRGIRTNARHTA